MESVKASCGALEARILKAAARAFGLNFTDPLNAPAVEYEIPSVPDGVYYSNSLPLFLLTPRSIVTFVKISLDEFNVVWHAGEAALEIALPSGFRMDTNDLAGQFYSKVSSFRVPEVRVRTLLGSDPRASVWYGAAEFNADFNIDVYSAPANWPEKAKIQSEFLATQDSQTGRAIFLYMPDQTAQYDSLAPGELYWIASYLLLTLFTGRGLLDTEFYLTQLRIPKSSSHVSSSFSRDLTKSPDLPTPSRLYRQNLHSDSEEEEWISEADRDARIAYVFMRTLSACDHACTDSCSVCRAHQMSRQTSRMKTTACPAVMSRITKI